MPRMTHNTVYPTEPEAASVLEGDVGSKSDRERLSEAYPESPLYTEYDPLMAFSDTTMVATVRNPDGSSAAVGYWGLNGYTRNYHIGAPKTSDLFPDGDEGELIGSSYLPSVKSPDAPLGSPGDALPSSETRAPFSGPSADDTDAQPYQTSIDIRNRTQELLRDRETLNSSGIPSLETLTEGS